MTHSDFDYIFEVSWEVCNKIGGIYTVLSSKSYELVRHYGDKIIFVGPYFDNLSSNTVFIEDNTLKKKLFDISLPKDVTIKVGRWNIPGNPIVVLVDFQNIYPMLNGNYALMWEKFGVDSLHSYGDYDESCAFSIASAMFIGAFYTACKSKLKNGVIAHFDEWTTGMGLLYLKNYYPEIATVFTTHATSIGRSICGNNKLLYEYFEGYNGDIMAGELNMQSKHSLEKAAAHNADCFTTVSELTADECRQLLDIRPQKVTPNGFEKKLTVSGKKTDSVRRNVRNVILRVASALTGKIFQNDTFILATSGRNEYRNKGLDLFLDSLDCLRNFNIDKDIIAFIMVPAWVKEPRNDLLHNIENKINERLNNPVITHNLYNENEDAILSRIKQLGFGNNVNERINVIFVPCYLNGNDGIFNLDYYDLLHGLDLTVFPSYYEPWGYTPHESISCGVPTITTCLSGFGRWVQDKFGVSDILETGVGVIGRNDRNYHETAYNIAKAINDVEKLKHIDWVKLSKQAKKTAESAQWKNFIKNYVDAYDIALHNCMKRK